MGSSVGSLELGSTKETLDLQVVYLFVPADTQVINQMESSYRVRIYRESKVPYSSPVKTSNRVLGHPK